MCVLLRRAMVSLSMHDGAAATGAARGGPTAGAAPAGAGAAPAARQAIANFAVPNPKVFYKTNKKSRDHDSHSDLVYIWARFSLFVSVSKNTHNHTKQNT